MRGSGKLGTGNYNAYPHHPREDNKWEVLIFSQIVLLNIIRIVIFHKPAFPIPTHLPYSHPTPCSPMSAILRRLQQKFGSGAFINMYNWNPPGPFTQLRWVKCRGWEGVGATFILAFAGIPIGKKKRFKSKNQEKTKKMHDNHWKNKKEANKTMAK